MAEEPKGEQPEAKIQDEDLDLDLELEDTLGILDGEQDAEKTKANVEQAKQFARQAVARAKKAEEELRLLKKPKETPPADPNPSPQPSVEETVLLANGMSEELLRELKVVAQVRGVSLLKAQTDPIFVAVKKKFEDDQKQKDASLPASRGSGQAKPKVTLSTPGLDRETHKKLAQEAAENL